MDQLIRMDVLQTIIQGGAVGLAAYVLFILQKLISNHISHNSEVLGELKEAIHKLADILDRKL